MNKMYRCLVERHTPVHTIVFGDTPKEAKAQLTDKIISCQEVVFPDTFKGIHELNKRALDRQFLSVELNDNIEIREHGMPVASYRYTYSL